MIEPATGSSEAAARITDALQAAYFRAVLSEHRAHIDAVLTKVFARIETHREAGDRFEATSCCGRCVSWRMNEANWIG
jgi:hypothetical protein